jgi:hypothetical protein
MLRRQEQRHPANLSVQHRSESWSLELNGEPGLHRRGRRHRSAGQSAEPGSDAAFEGGATYNRRLERPQPQESSRGLVVRPPLAHQQKMIKFKLFTVILT